jgi:hypothetical protein
MTTSQTTRRIIGQNDGSSSPSWERVHARTASLREVITTLDAGGPLPDVVAGAFTDRDELLLALQGVWSRRLNGRIDLALETDDHDLAESVARAWNQTADDLPGVRRVLDEHADRPALRHVMRHEQRAVAVAAGLATFDDRLTTSSAAGAHFIAALRRRPTALVPKMRWWRRIAE